MKTLLITAASLILATAAGAQVQKVKKVPLQPKAYFRAGLGYAMPHGGAVQDNGGLPTNGSFSAASLPGNESETFDLKRASYSAGVQGILGVGVMFKNIGVEVAANAGLSTKTYTTSFNQKLSGQNNDVTISSKSDLPLLITPALVLQTGGKINLYARGGITLPVKTIISESVAVKIEKFNQSSNSFVTTDDVKYTRDYSMRLSPGFSGAMGVKIKPVKKLTVFGELGMLSMSLYLKEAELTEYNEFGQSTLSGIPPSQRLTQFDFKGTSTANNNIAPTTQVPFSNFNFSAGIALDL